jgi:hypothetical protein
MATADTAQAAVQGGAIRLRGALIQNSISSSALPILPSALSICALWPLRSSCASGPSQSPYCAFVSYLKQRWLHSSGHALR